MKDRTALPVKIKFVLNKLKNKTERKQILDLGDADFLAYIQRP
jgi:hypothetical protein